MSQNLSIEVKHYLWNHPKIKLSDEEKELLGKYDSDTQMQWVTNPLITFFIQQFLQSHLPPTVLISFSNKNKIINEESDNESDPDIGINLVGSENE
jgi:hypothetical protein